MTRMFICGALQIAFVTAYGTLAAVRTDQAVDWLLPFIAVVWILVIYNNWHPIWTGLRVVWTRVGPSHE